MKKAINKPIENIVQSMRQIRDEISNEIKDMSFAEEREFLDKILKIERSKNMAPNSTKKRILSAK